MAICRQQFYATWQDKANVPAGRFGRAGPVRRRTTWLSADVSRDHDYSCIAGVGLTYLVTLRRGVDLAMPVESFLANFHAVDSHG